MPTRVPSPPRSRVAYPYEHTQVVAQLQQENSGLASRNEQLAGQVGFLQAKLQEAEKQIALLVAPKEPERAAKP